jgi:hypothetical protein
MMNRLLRLGAIGVLAACSGGDSPTGPGSQHRAPSLTTSTIASSAESLTANGVSTAKITVTLLDANGAAISRSGGTVLLQAIRGSVASVSDHSDGTYTATYTSSVLSGAELITAALNGQPLVNSVALSLVPGPVELRNSRWSIPENWLYADGVSSMPMTLFVYDAYFNQVTLAPGAVAMATTKGTLSAVGPGLLGGYRATITSTSSVETAIVTATVNGQLVPRSDSVRFDTHQIWLSKAPLPTVRRAMGVGVVNGILYAVGGDSTWTAAPLVHELDAYDPVANTWTPRAPVPTARDYLAVGVVNGIVYAVGGRSTVDSKVVEAYDPVADSWSSRAPMLTGRAELGIGELNGILYAVGGNIVGTKSISALIFRDPFARPRGANGLTPTPETVPADNVLNTLEAYDPATDTWTPLPPMPTARAQLGVGVVNGIVYAVGGRDGMTDLSTVEAYDPVTHMWSTKTPMPTARSVIGVSVINGKLYAIGGAYRGLETNIVEVYDPATDRWATTGTLLQGRMAPGTAVLGGLIYAVGGACYDDVIDAVEAFVP